MERPTQTKRQLEDLLDDALAERIVEAHRAWDELRDLHQRASMTPSRWTDTIEERRELESTLRTSILEIGNEVVETIAAYVEPVDAPSLALSTETLAPQLVELVEEAARTWTRLRTLDGSDLESPGSYLERSERRRELETRLEGMPSAIGTRLVEHGLEEARVDGDASDVSTGGEARTEDTRGEPEPLDTSETSTASESEDPDAPDGSSNVDEPSTDPSESTSDTDPETSSSSADTSVDAPESSGETLDADDLAELEMAMSGGEALERDASRQSNHDRLTREFEQVEYLQSAMGEVVDTIHASEDMRRELRACENVLDTAEEHTWSMIDDDFARAVVRVLTTRLRRLQEHLDKVDDSSRFEHRVDSRIQELTKISSIHRPGFVHGLQRDHEPQHGGSWTYDLDRALDTYESELEAYSGVFPGDDGSEITQSDRDRAFTELQQTLEAGDEVAFRDELERYLDEGYFDPTETRLVNLASRRPEWFGGEQWPKLERAIRETSEEDGDDGQRFDEPIEALEVADDEFAVLDVWSDAREAARDSNYSQPDKLYRALEAIAAVGRREIECFEDDEGLGETWASALQKEAAIPIDHSLKESEITSSQYERTFTDRNSNQSATIERHLTFGQGGSHSNALQIYFSPPEDADDDVDVGHCGPHLEHYSQ
jgi:hypothetical protein